VPNAVGAPSIAPTVPNLPAGVNPAGELPAPGPIQAVLAAADDDAAAAGTVAAGVDEPTVVPRVPDVLVPGDSSDEPVGPLLVGAPTGGRVTEVLTVRWMTGAPGPVRAAAKPLGAGPTGAVVPAGPANPAGVAGADPNAADPVPAVVRATVGVFPALRVPLPEVVRPPGAATPPAEVLVSAAPR